MLLGKTQFSSMVDNHLGKKLGIPLNSLGSKLMGGTKKHVQFPNSQNQEKHSPLERR